MVTPIMLLNLNDLADADFPCCSQQAINQRQANLHCEFSYLATQKHSIKAFFLKLRVCVCVEGGLCS